MDRCSRSGSCCRRAYLENSRSGTSMASRLRPDGALVALDAAGGAAGGRASGDAGTAAYESPLCRAARARHFAALYNLDLSHAVSYGGQGNGAGRDLRAAPDWRDRSQRDFYVPAHLGRRTLQGRAGKPYRDNPGSPAATTADSFLL